MELMIEYSWSVAKQRLWHVQYCTGTSTRRTFAHPGPDLTGILPPHRLRCKSTTPLSVTHTHMAWLVFGLASSTSPPFLSFAFCALLFHSLSGTSLHFTLSHASSGRAAPHLYTYSIGVHPVPYCSSRGVGGGRAAKFANTICTSQSRTLLIL